MTNRRLLLNLIGIFMFGFCFVSMAYVGLPVDFNADHVNNVKGAESVSYPALLRMILNPFTPAWFYPAEGRMEYLRPFQFLLMKFFFETFNYDLGAVHITAAVGHGLLLVVFALIILFYSGNILYGWLAAFLYTSFPSNFFMMTSVFSMDFQYFVSLLTIASLSLFFILTANGLVRRAALIFSLLGWIASIWLAIKLKSSEKILPFIMAAFLLARARFSIPRVGWKRLLVLIVLLACMLPLVAPLKCFARWTPKPKNLAASIQTAPTTAKDRTTFAFQGKNLLERTFFVPGGEFPFTTVLRRKIPRSFTENYGFFLGWLFWAGLAWLLWQVTHIPRTNTTGEIDELRRHAAWLIMIWFFATIAGFANGINVLDTRLLNFAYVPSILLFFVIVSFFERAYLTDSKRRVWFQIFLAAIVILTSANNFAMLGKLIGHYGGMQDALVRAEKDVFQTVYHSVPTKKILYNQHGDLEGRAVIVDWYDLPAGWLLAADGKIRREGAAYFYTRRKDSPRLQELREAGYSVRLWNSYDFLDAKPMLFHIIKKAFFLQPIFRNGKNENAILVYQLRKPAVQ